MHGIHTENKLIFTCDVCGKSFKRKMNFQSHMLTHSDGKVGMECKYCGEWLKTKLGVYYHEQVMVDHMK